MITHMLYPGTKAPPFPRSCTTEAGKDMYTSAIYSDLNLISFYIGPVSEDVGRCPYPGDGCSSRTAQSGRVSYREHEAVHPEALQALH